MIQEVEIRNYKSITNLTLSLGRVNVFIGANGSGKSNILEALAIGSAAANNKLDNEFLVSRGIRVSDDPRFMRSAFDKQSVENDIEIVFKNEQDDQYTYELQKDNKRPYSPWTKKSRIANEGFKEKTEWPVEDTGIVVMLDGYVIRLRDDTRLWELSGNVSNEGQPLSESEHLRNLLIGPADLRMFLVYSPENSALRVFEQEGQIQPLGIRGEGLFKLLQVMSATDPEGLEEVRRRLLCLDWFEGFDMGSHPFASERSLHIRDRYLDDNLPFFDQKSANEGFLFLLFYFALFISKETPDFFAIDNIDASLNPKLCSQLMVELAELARDRKKQVVCTTHNPAILDGLDLSDDQQRLFVVSRNRQGHTRVKRIPAPQSASGHPPVRLSEAFLRGYLGGLPDNF